MVLGSVHGDPVQPGIELGIAAETADRAIRADERVLGDILTFTPVGDVAPDQRHDPMLVLAHQDIERRTFAALHAPDQFKVQLLWCFNLGHVGPHSCQPDRCRAMRLPIPGKVQRPITRRRTSF
ncbi:hypothetical protein D3C71_1132190 [compost metagenome]